MKKLENLPITEITMYSLRANVEWGDGQFGLLQMDAKPNELLFPHMKYLRKVWIDRVKLRMITALDREANDKLLIIF